METDAQPAKSEAKRRLPCHPYLLVVLAGIPIFFFINKLFLAFYLGRFSQWYAAFERQINPGLVLIEIMFLLFLLWLSKRRWYQYSLRTLMIVVTLFALLCSWFTVKMQQARRQMEAVEALIGLKGHLCSIRYDYMRDSADLIVSARERRYGAAGQPPDPAWLRDLLGIDFFSNVTEVWLTGKITDADLAHLKEFPKLRVLFFNEILENSNPQVTDEGLKIVQELTQLEDLGLCSTNITDAGMERIGKLVHLRSLGLQNTRISDAGLRHLQNLSQLQRLRLANTEITDAGLENLKALTNLQFLDLQNTRITGTGFEHLIGLHGLQEIRLGNTTVGGDGVKNLRKALPKLKIELYPILEL